eukprot:CAMPEP_0171512492 /NCGR_PEP_ID=MMETSP0959-20130129/1622_1 /TAXON_ID=87120 /ORGANISM="Aurantiochytrium limacinum, Strain ATCCMYA-1381" /LENGTH=154 /DNA_ID=CAMNT_0012050319 /DNA_START=71 /DNA_END=532 /DNA_ORIENTATION=-
MGQETCEDGMGFYELTIECFGELNFCFTNVTYEEEGLFTCFCVDNSICAMAYDNSTYNCPCTLTRAPTPFPTSYPTRSSNGDEGDGLWELLGSSKLAVLVVVPLCFILLLCWGCQRYCLSNQSQNQAMGNNHSNPAWYVHGYGVGVAPGGGGYG